MDAAYVLSHPDGVSIRLFLETLETRKPIKTEDQWWSGLPDNAKYFDHANQDTLLKLVHVPGAFCCPRCGQWTNIPDTTRIWFLKMSFGVWLNSGTLNENFIEVKTRVPFTFCQNYKYCREMVFLFESGKGLGALSVEDPRLDTFLKSLLADRYKK